MKTKMLRTIAIGLVGGAIVALAGCNRAPEATVDEAEIVDAVENQRFCPVMETMQIDKDIHVVHEGKRVYFCCPACIQTFQADPATYMERLKERHADHDREPSPEAHDHEHEHDHEQEPPHT